jgi:TPR repeat protein
MRPGSLSRTMRRSPDHPGGTEAVLRSLLLAGIILCATTVRAENVYKTDRQDRNEKVRKMELRPAGLDPFAFETAAQMYKSGPQKAYDETAGRLIERIGSGLTASYGQEGPEGFEALLRQLQPYRKTRQAQDAIGKWAARYFEALPKTSKKSLKSLIMGGSKKIGRGGGASMAQAEALYRKGDFAKAARQYRGLLQEIPLHPDARNNLALAQLHQGQDLSAQFELELLRLIKPDYLPAKINLSVVLERVGRSAEARRLALAAAARNQDAAVADFNAAWYRSLDGEYRAAVQALKPVAELELKPKYRAFYEANAALLKRGGASATPKVSSPIQAPVVPRPVPAAPLVQKPPLPAKVASVSPTPKSKTVEHTSGVVDMYRNARKLHRQGGPKAYGLAMKWYRRAADKGYAAAMNSIGSMYEHGEGVARDERQAAAWYRRAADKGYATAMYNLGVMYARGRGVARDDSQAIQWYRRAADKGDTDAMNNLGVIYETGQGVTESAGGALKWYRQAADKGHAGAMANLGRLYEKGYGVAKDRGQAVQWYERAAAKGSANAMNRLGLICEGQQDFATAVQWYRKAAAKEDPGALGNLGYCYETGRGVPRDLHKALGYYRQAADLGSRFARDALQRLQ